MSALDAAMSRLRRAERERRAAIDDLIKLGAIRSHVLVGDLGELIAARYYGVELLPAFRPAMTSSIVAIVASRSRLCAEHRRSRGRSSARSKTHAISCSRSAWISTTHLPRRSRSLVTLPSSSSARTARSAGQPSSSRILACDTSLPRSWLQAAPRATTLHVLRGRWSLPPNRSLTATRLGRRPR